ncbi:Cytidine deaminase-like protein [Pseudocohnilembus persalinus]|uniref:Cytidine deaminase n=1 Tax=Pseudocohnilembus persalinus TaxID=266149 RepID=A0A0V0QZB6_PSEPJ|nr:Cytidine deaminase-like protein [Pseudocohnilembus persalinus]|eukprot:KRX07579.1 Cytidine deaminase-like protein [Pseudocohnilembus persalinus]
MQKLEESQIKQLINDAIEVRKNAYSVYSNFQVGCALITDKDIKYQGVNVENASYGLTICAERCAITTAVTHGMKKIKVLAVTADTKTPVSPCGACRQVISEFSDKNTIFIISNIKGDYEIKNINDLLPGAFNPAHLDEENRIQPLQNKNKSENNNDDQNARKIQENGENNGADKVTAQ